MSDGSSQSDSLSVAILRGMDEVAPAEWDAIAGPDDPFAEHAFLAALEASRSVGPGTGWIPRHVVVRRGPRLVGAIAAYRKDDSWGEFVFDFHWARAAAQAGIRYFPKLVAMAPFTPATGRRVLVAPGEPRDEVVPALVRGLHQAADEMSASSIHVLYVNDEERAELLRAPGFMPRLSVQFHFVNEGYRTFDDLLARMRSPSRKQIRRERREVHEAGLVVRVKEGPELDDGDWHALQVFYRLNAARHGAFGYLTPAFFPLLRERFAHRVVAVIAYKGDEPIAGSLNFEKGDVLYGRYWGATEEVDFLHFECCYHRLIERAIEKGHRRVEAGAQGLHKIKRGLLPRDVHSVHWIRDARLRRAIAEFLPEEARAVRAEAAELAASGPFRRDGEPGER